ncbi:hypothetical protein SJA_C1-31420 [Sphingobium indicum UT26S]|uniref:Uncharacterized protein n=1 Tax=Sphingobium indicum (strain DSM 16413 / CCM 7287 / MTCC 6362 / UT26 / NBRC 101211 / UT26S) TaxID=452662 RepID=D4Z5U4_SPHIU|nr:hypothetical protein SJA_C1-31420 [Sphingobium indicum UT26S]
MVERGLQHESDETPPPAAMQYVIVSGSKNLAFLPFVTLCLPFVTPGFRFLRRQRPALKKRNHGVRPGDGERLSPSPPNPTLKAPNPPAPHPA